jgi:hypothetical protein
MLTEQALERLLALGSDRRGFLNSPRRCRRNFSQTLRGMADEAGAQIVSGAPCSSEYEASALRAVSARFDDAADESAVFAFCNIVGADILRLPRARDFLPILQEVYFERFSALPTSAHVHCGSVRKTSCGFTAPTPFSSPL